MDWHIIVGVKHRDGTMGLQDLRSFIAALRPRHKELYVSTSGFTKEARYKADRAYNQVSLIDCDELVNLIIHFYDSFDAEAGSLLPLRKIYWPEEDTGELPARICTRTECHLVFRRVIL
jgi:restriction system protein